MKRDTGRSFGLGCWDTSFRGERGRVGCATAVRYTDRLLPASAYDGWLMLHAKAWDGRQAVFVCDVGHVLVESVLVWCLDDGI